MKIDIDKMVFEKARLDEVDDLVDIIHRCITEVNSKDYESLDINRFLAGIDSEKISSDIINKHFYVVKYYGDIVGMGAVARDRSQENQCYFTSIFIKPNYHRMGVGRKIVEYLEEDEWCFDSKLIEIPASKTAHIFYYRLGYEYYTYPPIFKEDGSTIMYKRRK